MRKLSESGSVASSRVITSVSVTGAALLAIVAACNNDALQATSTDLAGGNVGGSDAGMMIPGNSGAGNDGSGPDAGVPVDAAVVAADLAMPQPPDPTLDPDGDGIKTFDDLCPFTPGQTDADGDGLCDVGLTFQRNPNKPAPGQLLPEDPCPPPVGTPPREAVRYMNAWRDANAPAIPGANEIQIPGFPNLVFTIPAACENKYPRQDMAIPPDMAADGFSGDLGADGFTGDLGSDFGFSDGGGAGDALQSDGQADMPNADGTTPGDAAQGGDLPPPVDAATDALQNG